MVHPYERPSSMLSARGAHVDGALVEPLASGRGTHCKMVKGMLCREERGMAQSGSCVHGGGVGVHLGTGQP